ncbi:alpha/beta fold hydrolase [Rugosimonospora africana]|uniref:Alpha/beta hydrolase n=1 Tax=Rugosimonospora africana TaxID=556532 RepID=A0A8J3QSZ0_9ACTN|nr:alpha/beta hydrolase [Rugosimonospora africana]GIH15200.1 alpha/beta hydrolase [Rugosimonospora africana]
MSDLVMSDFETHSVTSQDGTRVGYRQLGEGPGIVLLHGSMESAQNHMQLARALAGRFTIYLPDRRGRGMTGPYGDAYGIEREVEDLRAVLTATGARNVFGVSASGLVALQAAVSLPEIERVAVYEPALLVDGYDQGLVGWIDRFDREIGDGDVPAALVTSMLGLELGPKLLNYLPRWLLEGFTNLAMKSEDKSAGPDDVTMRKLAPTIGYEGRLIRQMAGTLGTFQDLKTPVLLLGGSKGLAFLKPSLDALERTLPNATRIEFAGLDHGGSSDVTKANAGGKPEVVAPELQRFFGAVDVER